MALVPRVVLADWECAAGLIAVGIPQEAFGADVVPCMGDCLGDNQVTVDELITMVNIALGNAEMSACENGDNNDDGQITVDEILTAVNFALNGCQI